MKIPSDVNRSLNRVLGLSLAASLIINPSFALAFNSSALSCASACPTSIFTTIALAVRLEPFAATFDEPGKIRLEEEGALLSPSPLGHPPLEGISEFGADAIRWFTHFSHERIEPARELLTELGFQSHAVVPGIFGKSSFAPLLGRTREEIAGRMGSDPFHRIRTIHVVSGNMDSAHFEAFQRDGHFKPGSTTETINGELVIRVPNGDGTYDVFVHEDHAARMLNHPEDVSLLNLYAFLYHENNELDPGQKPTPGLMTHDELVRFGATTEAVERSLNDSSIPNEFLKLTARELGINLTRVRQNSLPLTGAEYQEHVLDTLRLLRNGELGTITYGFNGKKFNATIARFNPDLDMTRIYDQANDRFVSKHGGYIKPVASWEDKDERGNDMPGIMGILEKVIDEGPKGWREETVVIVPDGGKKTRFATKILSEGYSGLTRLVGRLYENIREFAFINALASLRYLPGDMKRYVTVIGSDQMRKLGSASIGGISLKDKAGLQERLKDASVINGGARMELLRPEEIRLLDQIAGSAEWTEHMVENVFARLPPLKNGASGSPEFDNRWEELKKIIDREKLTQQGTFSASPDGLMTGFMEKQEDLGMLIRLVYDTSKRGDYLYKNPFDITMDKRFAERLLRALKDHPSTTVTGQSLDRIPVSIMQTLFQSRFVNTVQWMQVRIDSKLQKKITVEDWEALKLVMDKVWEDEKGSGEGRGQIYVLDYGDGYRWMDVADLREWNAFLNTVVADDEVRTALGVKPGVESDPETVRIEGQLEIKGDEERGGLYIERVLVTGGGTLIVVRGSRHVNGTGVDDRTLLSNVHFHIPEGQVLVVDAGAKVLDSDIDMDVTKRVYFFPGSLTERVFSSRRVGRDPRVLVTELMARSDERTTLLQILGEDGLPFARGLVRSLISYPFTKQTLDSLDPVRWERLRTLHPEYLGPIEWRHIQTDLHKVDFYSLPDPALGGLSTDKAQPHANYAWQENLFQIHDQRMDQELGLSSHAAFERRLTGPGTGAIWSKWLLPILGPMLTFTVGAVVEGLITSTLAHTSHGQLGVMLSVAVAAAIIHLFGIFTQDPVTGEWKAIGIQNLKSVTPEQRHEFWKVYFSANAIAATSLFAFVTASAGTSVLTTLVAGILPHLLLNLLTAWRAHAENPGRPELTFSA